MTGVVVIVATIPCYCMGDMASVTSGVRPSYVGSLAPRWGLGRGGVCVRAQEGSGEAELASEAQGGRARWNLRPRLRGQASGSLCSTLGNLRCLPYPLFAIFIPLIWVSLFMVPNSSPRAFGGVKTPLQRFFFKGQSLLIWSFLFPSGGAPERTRRV